MISLILFIYKSSFAELKKYFCFYAVLFMGLGTQKTVPVSTAVPFMDNAGKDAGMAGCMISFILFTPSSRHWRNFCPNLTAGPCRPRCPKVRISLENAVEDFC